MTAAVPDLHPDCEPLAFLLGRWEGEGKGLWSEPPFEYREEVVFEHIGKPFLRYTQRTWSTDGARALHSETGYLRPAGPSAVELVVAQPTGIVEVHAGLLDSQTLELEPIGVHLTPTAKPVTGVSRRIWVDAGGALRYLVRMGMNGEPPADHLTATLLRR
jgi:hypothetical protein